MTVGSSEELYASLLALGLQLPFRASAGEPGEILDANGLTVCVVDPHREDQDAKAHRIAELIVCAINFAAES